MTVSPVWTLGEAAGGLSYSRGAGHDRLRRPRLPEATWERLAWRKGWPCPGKCKPGPQGCLGFSPAEWPPFLHGYAGHPATASRLCPRSPPRPHSTVKSVAVVWWSRVAAGSLTPKLGDQRLGKAG